MTLWLVIMFSWLFIIIISQLWRLLLSLLYRRRSAFLPRLELFSHRRRHRVIMCNIQRFFSFNGKNCTTHI